MRVITLDDNNNVISVKNVGNNYVFGANDIETDLGEIGQIMQMDGTFVDAPQVEPAYQTSLTEQITIVDNRAKQTSNDLQGFMDYYFSTTP